MLEATILESLRLLPPAYLVGRCATQSINVDRYQVAKGMVLPSFGLRLLPYQSAIIPFHVVFKRYGFGSLQDS